MKKIVFITALFLGFGLIKTYGQDEPSVQPNTTINTTTTTTTTTTSPAVTTPTVAVPITEVKMEHENFHRGYIGAIGLASFTDIKLKSVDNSAISTSTTVGWGGGGLIGVDLSRHVDLELEVLYSSLSQKYKNTFGEEDRLDVSYINIPLLIGLNTDVSNPVNLNITAGPQMGFNVGSSIHHESTGQPNVDTVNAVLAVKKSDLGLAFGAGLDFRIADAVKISVGYRGVRGLIDISDNSKNLTTNDYYILDRSHVNTNSAYAALSILF